MPKIMRTVTAERLQRDADRSDQRAKDRADLTLTIQRLLVVTPHEEAQAVIRRLAAAGVYTSEAAAHLLDTDADQDEITQTEQDGTDPTMPDPRFPEPPFVPDGDTRALLKTRAAVSILWRTLETGTIDAAQALELLTEFGKTVDDMPELEADPEFVEVVANSLSVSYGIEPPEGMDFEEWERAHRRAAERLAKTLGRGRIAATLV